MSKKIDILITKSQKDYELIDSGDGEKMERFGSFVLRRPDPQALWRKKMYEEWNNVDAHFIRTSESGDWKFKKGINDKWPIEFNDLKFFIKPTAFKHTGLFPEQSVNWDWLKRIINNNKVDVLNLFAYTGGATLTCASAGAKVVHVDSSKSAVTWARENAELSGLSLKPIRWIIEDARLFVKREIKRNSKYDGIIMDPPAFGHGVKKEIWRIEQDFINLIEDCFLLLKDKPLFFLINGYSSGYSAIAYENIMKDLIVKYGGVLENGELAIEDKSGNLLPCGIFSRWNNKI